MANPTAVVVFDHIGRNHNPPSVAIMSDNAEFLAAAVYKHARAYLGSRDVEAVVDLDADTNTGEARIYVGGFRLVGTGKVTILYPEAATNG